MGKPVGEAEIILTDASEKIRLLLWLQLTMILLMCAM